MTIEGEIKKLTEAIIQNTAALSPAPTAPAPTAPAPNTGAGPGVTITAEALQSLMAAKSTELGDNGAACTKIIADLAVSGIAQMSNEQRQNASLAVGNLVKT